MILIGGVDGRRVSKGMIVAILVLIACNSSWYAWRHVQKIRREVQMRQEIRERIEELTQVCEQIRQERP